MKYFKILAFIIPFNRKKVCGWEREGLREMWGDRERGRDRDEV